MSQGTSPADARDIHRRTNPGEQDARPGFVPVPRRVTFPGGYPFLRRLLYGYRYIAPGSSAAQPCAARPRAGHAALLAQQQMRHPDRRVDEALDIGSKADRERRLHKRTHGLVFRSCC